MDYALMHLTHYTLHLCPCMHQDLESINVFGNSQSLTMMTIQCATPCMNAGLMQKSKIGEGNVESRAASVNERRTSSTVLLDSTVVEQHPQLQPMVLQLQAKAQKLLDIGMSSLVTNRKDLVGTSIAGTVGLIICWF